MYCLYSSLCDAIYSSVQKKLGFPVIVFFLTLVILWLLQVWVWLFCDYKFGFAKINEMSFLISKLKKVWFVLKSSLSWRTMVQSSAIAIGRELELLDVRTDLQTRLGMCLDLRFASSNARFHR
jgi:hypothetical protein